MSYSTINLLIAYIIIDTPLKLKQSKPYQEASFYIHHQAVVNSVKPYVNDYILTTESYSKSAVLYYYTGKYISVFGPGSCHARHDDMYTDFRQFDGKNFIIIRTLPPDMNKYVPYFQNVSVKKIKLEDTTLYLVIGNSFKYDIYREKVLRSIKDNYYQIPTWLPMKGNYFTDKYFKED